MANNHLPTQHRRVSRPAGAVTLAGLALLLVSMAATAQAPTAEQVEFFEKNIRPVLANNCYQCHGEDVAKLKGGLNLTYRSGIRTGGDNGPALIPGDPGKSMMVEAIEYNDEDFQMPPKKGKLPDEAIANIRTWIAMGAPDPRDEPLPQGGLEDEETWIAVRQERLKWWSFQPIAQPQPPAVTQAEWASHPVDRFIKEKIDAAGLSPAPLADPRTLIRRLTYVLTGLPPTPEQSELFAAAAAIDQQAAVEDAVDRLLESPRYGERWARHWMDWMRYAETHGSEGDPAIPNAWRYRDYLIRAMNADVPFDQLVREHLAGDILPEPRINSDLNINESILGTAQYRLVLHGYSPTDALDEQVRFTENQIDVISKGFLGITVACARCHNHKFDPISQKDFYALYGIMASSRPATVTIDTQERLETNKTEMASLKPKFREALSKVWLKATSDTAENLLHPEAAWKEAIEPKQEEEGDPDGEEKRKKRRRYRERYGEEGKRDPLYVWRLLRNLEGEAFEQQWETLREEWRASEEAVRAHKAFDYAQRWDLSGDDAAAWFGKGNGLTSGPSQAGEFTILPKGDRIVGNIFPAGVYSNTFSDKHSAVFSSPRFPVTSANVYVKIIGDGNAAARYVVQNYPLRGETYPMTSLEEPVWRWQKWNAEYWEGDHLYIELSTAADKPALMRRQIERSWFGISEAVVVEEGQPEPRNQVADFIAPLFDAAGAPPNASALAERYAKVLRECISAWRGGSMSNAQALFLDYFVATSLLPNDVDNVRGAKKLLAKYRTLEQEIPVPKRSPGVLEGKPFDQPLFTRGNHRQPVEPVPRRFLEAIDDTPYGNQDAGRAALAESILQSDNPLTPRVIANRLWHHIFGSGIVATPDNFGQMGEMPSHPELLDYLATRFVNEDWSIKQMLHFLTTSRTFQLSVAPSSKAKSIDPTNRFLSHANLRRLEAEAIRDGMLMVAGRIDLTPFGKPVGGQENRRSVYVRVIRNRLDPFLTVFNAPVPTSTMGRRNVTNVPAQALTMMNSPFVIDLAGSFAERVQNENPERTPDEQIARMFELALGRPPMPDEAASARAFLDTASHSDFINRNKERAEAEIAKRREKIDQLTSEKEEDEEEEEERDERRNEERERLEREIERLAEGVGAPDSWHELAHAIFTLKEFIYLM